MAQALHDLAAGTLSKPTEHMKTGYYLSHHVMEGRHSEKSCLRKMYQLGKRLGVDSKCPALKDADDSDAHDALSSADAEDSDSDDELELAQPISAWALDAL